MKSDEKSQLIHCWAKAAAERVLLHGSTDADDIAQDTWLVIAKLGKQGPTDDLHLRKLVYRIATNRALDVYRNPKHQPLDESVFEFKPQISHPGYRAARLAKVVWDCLENDERDLVAMRAHEGLSYGQIAHRMKRSRSTVSSAIQRLPNKIKKRLQDKDVI